MYAYFVKRWTRIISVSALNILCVNARVDILSCSFSSLFEGWTSSLRLFHHFFQQARNDFLFLLYSAVMYLKREQTVKFYLISHLAFELEDQVIALVLPRLCVASKMSNPKSKPNLVMYNFLMHYFPYCDSLGLFSGCYHVLFYGLHAQSRKSYHR